MESAAGVVTCVLCCLLAATADRVSEGQPGQGLCWIEPQQIRRRSCKSTITLCIFTTDHWWTVGSAHGTPCYKSYTALYFKPHTQCVHTCTQACTHRHTHRHTHTHIYAHARMHAHTHSQTHSHSHTFTHTLLIH